MSVNGEDANGWAAGLGRPFENEAGGCLLWRIFKPVMAFRMGLTLELGGGEAARLERVVRHHNARLLKARENKKAYEPEQPCL